MTIISENLKRKRIIEYKKCILQDLKQLIKAISNKNKTSQHNDYEALKNHVDYLFKYKEEKAQCEETVKSRIKDLGKYIEEKNTKLANQEIKAIIDIIAIQ